MTYRLLLALFVSMVLVGSASSVWAKTKRHERFEYNVVYKGPVTSYKPLDISKAIWSGPGVNSGDTSEVSVLITSEKHMKVEMMFPFRYCFKTKFNRSSKRSLGFEHSQRAGTKAQHISAQFDWKRQILRSKRLKAELPGVSLNPFDGFRQEIHRPKVKWKTHSEKSILLPNKLLDQISMVQYLRMLPLKAGQVISIPLSDGIRMLAYWVDVMYDNKVKAAGRRWKAFRLRFETFDPVMDKAPHPPVDIWLSRDKRRIPLRLSSSFQMGEVDIHLTRIGRTRNNGMRCKSWPGFYR